MNFLRRWGGWITAVFFGGVLVLVGAGALQVDSLWSSGSVEYNLVGRSRVHYERGARRQDAVAVGDFLQARGYFKVPADVVMRVRDGVLDVALVVQDPSPRQEDREFHQQLWRDLTQQVLAGRSFTLSTCDSYVVLCRHVVDVQGQVAAPPLVGADAGARER
jgi:hypothetical protein